MPNYVRKELHSLQNPKPKIPQYAPHRWSVPAYGKRLQMTPYPDKSDLIDNKTTNRIHNNVGTMLYYPLSVHPTMMTEINEILLVQSRPKRDTAEKAKILLDYAATYPNVITCYKDSDMVLHVDSDTSYLTVIEASSCYSGNFYLSDWPTPSSIKPNPERNAPIHTLHMRCAQQSSL